MVCALVVLAVGCSGSKKSPSPTASSQALGVGAVASTTAASTAAGGQYLTAADALDASYLRWKAQLVGKTRVNELTAPASSYAAALTAFDQAIARVAASGQTATDITKLETDDAVVIADLDSITHQAQATLSHWSSQLMADGAKALQAGSLVRADFKLPAS
jgi:ABC-type molybdate transport system substrate-binding protein